MTLFADGESITRRRYATSADRYGNVARSTATDTTITGVLVAPQAAGEVTPLGRQGVPGGVTLYCPPGTDLAAHDVVVVRGGTYEVEGDALAWRSASSDAYVGVVADAQRMAG